MVPGDRLKRGAMSIRRVLTWTFLVLLAAFVPALGSAQELGGAGTVQGTVKDPTGGVMQSVEVKITNPVSGFTRTTTTDAAGKFVFRNLPPNPYHVAVERAGIPAARARRRRPDAACRSTLDLSLGARGHDRDRRGRRPCRGSARARSDGAHRHRSEPDRRSCRSSPPPA